MAARRGAACVLRKKTRWRRITKRGAIVLPVNAWEQFDEPGEVAVSFASRDESIEDAVIGDEIVAAFEKEGLKARREGDLVYVDVTWRYHVAHWNDFDYSE